MGGPLALPIINERGERLLAMDETVRSAAVSQTLAFALVIGVTQERILLVRNRHRRVWELPGGLIDPGESPAQCALRELYEESGQIAVDPKWLGQMTLQMPDRGEGPRVSYGALYRVALSGRLASFRGNDEIEASALWPISRLPPDVSAIDAALAVSYGRDLPAHSV
jgi:8-oxo-dGTP diphosphatase